MKIIAALPVILAFVLASPCFGDDGAVSAVGGGVRPMAEHSSIRLVAEYVHIDFRQPDVPVECVFFLENRGPATSVTIGFPNVSEGADVQGIEPFSSFVSYVDGDSVPVTILPDADHQEYGDYRAWYVKQVDFEAGQTRCIRNVYTGTIGSYSIGQMRFEYILWSGATWEGPIGVADVVVSWDSARAPIDSIEIRPPGYKISNGEIRWHFTEIEPFSWTLNEKISLLWPTSR